MKIEKISDTQIRCILTKNDLKERHLKISELAYGSEKAKELFRDMMEQASIDFGFESEDIPLMIEAIPTARESIILVITKVENPDEFEEKFSHFSPPDEDDILNDLDQSDSDSYDDEYDTDGVNVDGLPKDLVNCFDQINDMIDQSDFDNKKEMDDDLFIPLHEAIQGTPKKRKIKKKKGKIPSPALENNKVYSFSSLERIIQAAHVIGTQYQGPNTLWKDEATNRYYLYMTKVGKLAEFKRTCDSLSEYGTAERFTYATRDYFDEHYKVIIRDKALLTLSVM